MTDAGRREGVMAVTGSPNTAREVRFDVLDGHQSSHLVGALVSFETTLRDGRKLLSLGQVSDARTSNRWHEEPGYKDYLKRRGRLPNLTGDADVTEGTLQVIGTYERTPDGWRKGMAAAPAGTGVEIRRVDRRTVEGLMSLERGHVNIGDFLGQEGVPAPVFARHFGAAGGDGMGSGEAFIGGVFGPSGSGKTVMGLSLATLWARHPGMGMLFLDPQGELRTDAVGGGTGFDYRFHDQLRRSTAGRFDPNRDCLTIDQIRLTGVALFVEILRERRFFESMAMSGEKVTHACGALAEGLGRLREHGDKPWSEGMSWGDLAKARMPPEEFPEEVEAGGATDFREWLALTIFSIYAGAGKLGKIRAALASPAAGKRWDGAAALFAARPGRHGLEEVVGRVLDDGAVTIVDLNPERLDLSASLRNDIVLLVFQAVSKAAEKGYRANRGGRTGGTNALVVLDEASTYVPRHTDDPKIRRIAKDLAAKAKMLRKLGVGMMLMTQRISGIDEDIFSQMHFRLYGAGLAMGGDAQAIRNMEGDAALALYSDLPNPRLSGRFSFMVAGALVAIGSSGQPMFVQGFKDGDTLMRENEAFMSPWNAPAAPGRRGAPRAGALAAAMEGLEEL